MPLWFPGESPPTAAGHRQRALSSMRQRSSLAKTKMACVYGNAHIVKIGRRGMSGIRPAVTFVTTASVDRGLFTSKSGAIHSAPAAVQGCPVGSDRRQRRNQILSRPKGYRNARAPSLAAGSGRSLLVPGPALPPPGLLSGSSRPHPQKMQIKQLSGCQVGRRL